MLLAVDGVNSTGSLPRQEPATRWEKDYLLEPIKEYGLLYEYLELG